MKLLNDEEILEHYRQTSTLQSVISMLSWDQEALMPSASSNLRDDQLALMATLTHKHNTQDNYIDSVMASNSTSPHFTRLKKELAQQRALSVKFVEKMSRASSECTRIWKKARETSDFNLAKDPLKNLLELNREQIELWKSDPVLKKSYSHMSQYEILLGEFDPGLKADVVRNLLKSLSTALSKRLPDIIEKQKSQIGLRQKALQLRAMPLPQQRQLLNDVLKDLGFDFSRGRIDESTHPFCGGSSEDIRMTTRYREDDFMDSLSSAIHECGHALYEQGLPIDSLRTPCGRTDSYAIHESQSRLYENMLGRSHEFCFYLSKKCGIGAQELYSLFNWVEPSFIRVDADEVTYNLHIALRMELEEALIEEKLKVDDLPEAWRAKFKELIGLEVENDSQGCLQDIHWYSGAFGYFPSYSLGNLLSAELFGEFTQSHPQWSESFRQGNFSELLKYLRSTVHEKASFEDTPSRIRMFLKNRDLGIESFLNYVDRKYL